MRSLMLIAVLAIAACTPPAGGYAVADVARVYAEGVRWERFDDAAAVVPPAEQAAFLDERDQLAKDLRITNSEIVRVSEHGRTAEVTVKHDWYKETEGTLHVTVATQRWERQGKAWRLVDEWRARGDEMPGLRERDDESVTSAPTVARAAAD